MGAAGGCFMWWALLGGTVPKNEPSPYKHGHIWRTRQCFATKSVTYNIKCTVQKSRLHPDIRVLVPTLSRSPPLHQRIRINSETKNIGERVANVSRRKALRAILSVPITNGMLQPDANVLVSALRHSSPQNTPCAPHVLTLGMALFAYYRKSYDMIR